MSDEEWNAASRGFVEALNDYFAARGSDSHSPQVRSTIRTNTQLVPQRAENILRFLQAFTGDTELQGKRILEVGCGFGALAGYLAWRYYPARLVAVDVRLDYLDAARKAAEPLGLGGRLEFIESDMRAMHRLGGRPFDVIIVNNAFIYLPTRKDMQRALEEFHRLALPGGRLLLYHVNRWQWREPFTHAPIVHLLPPRAGTAVSAVTGWKHNHGRVRLLSQPEIKRRLRRARFANVQSGGIVRGEIVTGAKARFVRFYAAGGTRPEH